MKEEVNVNTKGRPWYRWIREWEKEWGNNSLVFVIAQLSELRI